MNEIIGWNITQTHCVISYVSLPNCEMISAFSAIVGVFLWRLYWRTAPAVCLVIRSVDLIFLGNISVLSRVDRWRTYSNISMSTLYSQFYWYLKEKHSRHVVVEIWGRDRWLSPFGHSHSRHILSSRMSTVCTPNTPLSWQSTPTQLRMLATPSSSWHLTLVWWRFL